MPDNSLNNDHDESLRMENELLRLKIQAEVGGCSHSVTNINPELENVFLNQVLTFEHSCANTKWIKIFDLLGKPDFKRADELNDDLMDSSLQEMIVLLSETNIEIDFSGTYDSRTKYIFITEELFNHEANDLQIPGMVTHFCYEEFHPNHKLDIENRAVEFLKGWFEQKLDEQHWCFDNAFILPEGKVLNKVEVIEKLTKIFDSYSAFTDSEYNFIDINFQLNGEGGMGHAEGYVKYISVLENNDKIAISGPFKLYLSLEYGWWSIFHIVFPGFKY